MTTTNNEVKAFGPKVGFYLLIKIYKNPTNTDPNVSEWIADAYYKLNMDDQFYKNVEHIRLKPLFNDDSSQLGTLYYENCATEMFYSVLEIIKVSLIEERNKMGKPFKHYAIEWNTPQKYEEEDVQAVVNRMEL